MNTTSYSPGATGGNREWLDGPLTILEPEATPFVSSLKKEGGAKNTYYEQVADTLDGVKVTGTREGDSGPKGGNKASKRTRFGAYLGRYFRSFGVTDIQQALSENGALEGIVSNEYAAAKAKAVRELKRDMEAAALSSLDTQGGSDDAMRMRGAFSWLAASQTPAVPASFLTPAAQRLTGVSALIESGSSSLTSVLQSCFNTCGGRKEYDGFIGTTFAGNVDGFTRVGPELNTNGTRVVYDGEKAKTIRLNVEVFDSTFGMINFIPSTFLRISTDGGTGDPTALLLVQREYWGLKFLETLHAKDDEEDAGGMSGYVKAVGGLFCSMPKANAFVYNS